MRKKPLIIFDDSNDPRGRAYKDNTRQQNLLMKGIMLSSSLVDASKYAGIKRTVDLYRTWDRISLRKDFHQALAEEGVDMSFIVKNLKMQAEFSSKDSVKLEALKTFLKALGLDKYTVDEEKSQGWEELVTKHAKQQEALPAAPKTAGYDVVVPQMPDSAKKERAVEDKLGKELYESTKDDRP